MHFRILSLFFVFCSVVCSAQHPDVHKIDLDTCRTFTSIESAMINPDVVYKLNLHKMKLKEFPEEILHLSNLLVLDLSKNKLTEIPEEIGELSHLVEVNLSKNKIVSFPVGLTQCHLLRKITLSQNEDSLPPIGNLSQLEYLDLWSNNLGYYPNEMKKLVQLKELDLRVINLNKQEQQRISSLLPNTKIHFSPSCDCAN